MTQQALLDSLERCPVIAAVNDRRFQEALTSPAEVIFLLGGSLITVGQRINAAHEAGKYIFIHIDLAEGIGKDRAGIQYLSQAGADGILSTRATSSPTAIIF